MPIGQRLKSTIMFYYLLTFVGLFVISTVIAVVCYVRIEKYRTTALSAQRKLDEMATASELAKIGSLIGEKQPRKSTLGTMLDYLDQMVYAVVPGLPEDTSAAVKVNTANARVRETLDMLGQSYGDITSEDANTFGLVGIIQKLNADMDNLTEAKLAAEQGIEDLQKRFDNAMAASFEKEQLLLAEKEKYQQRVSQIQKSYNELKALMEQSVERQVQILSTQLDEEKANNKNLNQQLLKTEAQLRIATDRINRLQEQIQRIMPQPDIEVAAFAPDGQIIMVDDQTKTVHLNIGRDKRVYRGLTFSVYDKNLPIPKDGKGKAEIEVFNVGDSISAAQITHLEPRKTIVVNDIVANLIWDSDKTNVFAVAGDFDLDYDGNTDYNGGNRVKTLIEKWGGRVTDTVSAETDFVVLGSAPEVLKKPTFEQMETDPTAMDRYEVSLEKLSTYEKVQSAAEALSVPVFNTDRFLLFIGYKTQASTPGAF